MVGGSPHTPLGGHGRAFFWASLVQSLIPSQKALSSRFDSAIGSFSFFFLVGGSPHTPLLVQVVSFSLESDCVLDKATDLEDPRCSQDEHDLVS